MKTHRERRRSMLARAFTWGAVLGAGFVGGAGATMAPSLPATEQIQITPREGFNLAIVDRVSPRHLIVEPTSLAHNWYAATFTGLPVGEEVTISIRSRTRAGVPAMDMRNWRGLHALVTEADPDAVPCYQTFRRTDDGTWEVQDPLLDKAARAAGAGRVPAQQAVPEAIAEAYLSDDGTTWCAWREIAECEAVPDMGLFRIRWRPSASTATVVMRVPFLPSTLDAILARLRAAQLPYVHVETLGRTAGRRAVAAIRVDATGGGNAAAQRTILVVAREHATEHASSWALLGMLEAVIGQGTLATRLRTETAWIFLPLEDPDGAAASEPEALTDRFRQPNDPATPPEVFAYARYLTAYVNGGRTIDLAVALHNVEAAECAHLVAPYVSTAHPAETRALNAAVYGAAEAAGFRTSSRMAPWYTGMMSQRLFGWCGTRLGACDVAFEVNDRYPAQRLSLVALKQLGGTMAGALQAWSSSDAGMAWHGRVTASLTARAQARAAYFAARGYSAERRTNFDVLTLGY